MARLTTFAVIAAAAVTSLAACSTPPNRMPSIVTNEVPYQPGRGTVQAVTQTPVVAVAGAGASSTSEPLKRLHVRMENGRMQYIDTASSIRPGARVELTQDRQIRTL